MPPIVTYHPDRQSDSVPRATPISFIAENNYTSVVSITRQNDIRATQILEKRQIQITTTITPTIGGGGGGGAANPLAPVQTLTRGAGPEEVPAATRPAAAPLAAPVPAPGTPAAQPNPRPTASGKNDNKDGSVFGVNLSWWQITGIAIACVAIACLVIYLVMKRRSRQQVADQKSKETQAEESRKAREEAARLREEAIPARMMGMGMGMGMGGGMGGGIGGYPVVLNQGATQPAAAAGGGKTEKRDRGRRKDRWRYSDSDDSWESSGTESYDDLSDGGTIRKRRRRKPRRRKDKKRGRKHRNGRYSDDEDDIPSSASSSFYARPKKEREKDRHRPAMRRRDATQDYPSRRVDAMPTRDQEHLPMGLGPPSGQARTPRTGSSGRTGGSSGRTPGTCSSGSGSGSRSGFAPTSGALDRNESRRKNWRDSVFSTYDSMKRAAVRHKYMDGKVRLQKQLEEEEKIEKHRQEKIREANEQLEREKMREAEILMELENEKLERDRKEREQRSVQQIANLFTKRQDSQSTTRSYSQDETTPIRIPMPQARPSYRNEPTPTRSNPPSRQHTQPHLQDSPGQLRMLPPQRQFSSPASAYNSALPEKQHRPRLATKRSSSELPYDAYDGVASVVSSAVPPPTRSKPSPFRRREPRRQDSDPPLKSAMRTPGIRRPERKATINNKPSTIRPKFPQFQSDTTQESVTNDFLSDWLGGPPSTSAQNSNPYQSAIESANLSPTGSVFVPVPDPRNRPHIKRGGLAPAPPPRARTKSSNSRMTEISSQSGGSRSGRDHGNQSSGGQGFGGGRDIGNWQSGVSNGPSDNQANKRWANRLRERR